MNNEEEKAIELLEDLLKQRNESKIQIKTYDLFGTIETVLNLIEKQEKEIEDKKEEAIAIARANYDVGMLEERSQWYKKINEKIEKLEQEKKDDGLDYDWLRDTMISTLQSLIGLIGKEE